MLDVRHVQARRSREPDTLESVGQQGCTELTAPIAGHVEIRPVTDEL